MPLVPPKCIHGAHTKRPPPLKALVLRCFACAQGYSELEGILSDAELSELASAQNIPAHVILRLTETLYICNKVRIAC